MKFKTRKFFSPSLLSNQSNYLKKVGKPEAQGLTLSPIPFDIMLPKLVEIISDSNKNIGTGGKQSYTFNTDNLGQQGSHWITLVIEVESTD